MFELAGRKPNFIQVPVALMDGIIGFLDLLAKAFPGLEVCKTTRCHACHVCGTAQGYLMHASHPVGDADRGTLHAHPKWLHRLDGLHSADHRARVHQDAAEFGRIGRYYATESMLVWDDKAQKYLADATPSYGSDTLEDFFTKAVKDPEGLKGQELGDAAVF